MTKERKRPRTSGTRDFLDTPMYRLVDRHRAILEKIRTREDAEYWGHMLIGEYYPEIPNSRGASGKLAALVGLTDYMDFYCTWGYYDLLKEGKTLEEAQMVLGERMARGIEEITRVLGQNRLRAGRCRCDSHRRDARRLRAARLSGSEIRGGGWILTAMPTRSAGFAPEVRLGRTSGDAGRSCRRRSGPRGPHSA